MQMQLIFSLGISNIIYMTIKVKSFVRHLSSSLLPQANYYRKIAAASFLDSFKYLFTLILFLNLLLTVYLFIRFNPVTINKFFNNLADNLNKYPYDLSIKVYNGRLSTLYHRPYFFWLEKDNRKRLFLVIDENAQPKDINQYYSDFLITPKDIVIKNRPKPIVLPLDYLDNHTIDRDNIVKLKDNILQLGKILPLVYLLSTPLLFLILSASSLAVIIIYLLIATAASLIIFRFFLRKQLNFKAVLKTSFHAITLPLLLDYCLMVFGFKPLPSLFLFLTTVFVFSAAYEVYCLSPTHRS